MLQSLLEIRHLQTLVALAETGSLAKAAERVFVTQSALSYQLKALEQYYGAALFERNTRPLRLTRIGERLLTLAREVLSATAQAEREVAQLVSGRGGQLRIAVECHTCFDWLMPAMDTFREHWPEVELDLISGFQNDPATLVEAGIADFAVLHDEPASRPGIAAQRLFRYETVAILSVQHPLAHKEFLSAEDFADQTLISYPVDEAMLDVMRHFLTPAGIKPKRRNAELTVAILQLVASGRGIAALPIWSVTSYLQRGYVIAKPIGSDGLYCELYGAMPESLAGQAYVRDFIDKVRATNLSLP
jgi:LysR family transcriptional regulator, regulator for metE and metH